MINFLWTLLIGLACVPFLIDQVRGRNYRRRDAASATFSDLGTSIEVDCRACGQFNRVMSHRLGDRPRCGRCKARLMPGKRLVICRVSPMNAALSTELDALWGDADRLWQRLADHVALQTKARAEARSEQAQAADAASG